jgi:hypothetical protein
MLAVAQSGSYGHQQKANLKTTDNGCACAKQVAGIAFKQPQQLNRQLSLQSTSQA